MKKGIIYDHSETAINEVYIGKLIPFLRSVAWGLRKIGFVLIVFGVFELGYIYGPLLMAQTRYKSKPEVKKLVTNSRILLIDAPTPTPAWNVPDKSYSVYIPKIEAVSRVIPDVNAADKKEYMTALKLGVAEASNLSHPGELGTTFLFAHSVGTRIDFARYNAVFYLLHKLETGDEIEIFYKDKLLKYKIEKREILPASDVSYLQPQYEDERLVLQTCYPPGTTWKRLIVVAKRVY